MPSFRFHDAGLLSGSEEQAVLRFQAGKQIFQPRTMICGMGVYLSGTYKKRNFCMGRVKSAYVWRTAPSLPGIQHAYSGGRKMLFIARHHGQAMLKGRGGNEDIRIGPSRIAAESAPAPSDMYTDR